MITRIQMYVAWQLARALGHSWGENEFETVWQTVEKIPCGGAILGAIRQLTGGSPYGSRRLEAAAYQLVLSQAMEHICPWEENLPMGIATPTFIVEGGGYAEEDLRGVLVHSGGTGRVKTRVDQYGVLEISICRPGDRTRPSGTPVITAYVFNYTEQPCSGCQASGCPVEGDCARKEHMVQLFFHDASTKYYRRHVDTLADLLTRMEIELTEEQIKTLEGGMSEDEPVKTGWRRAPRAEPLEKVSPEVTNDFGAIGEED